MQALKLLVVVMGVLILAGTVTLVVVIVQRAGGGGAMRQAWALGQPEGTRIIGIAATDGALAVLVARPDGDRVLLLDVRRGKVAGEIRPAQ